jgi:thiosulfate/3-mercaptopyruvate sulfurtransferase
MEALVTTEWLAGALGRPDLLVLDASYTSTLPGSPTRDPRAAFEAGHIPGARFLDLDTLVDADDPLPSMLPKPQHFGERMRALGATADTRIILYDGGPHHTACRAWWVLRMFGVEASLLDGDIAKWQREGRTLETGAGATAMASDFEQSVAKSAVRTLAEMRANLDSRAEQVARVPAAARATSRDRSTSPVPASSRRTAPGSRRPPSPRSSRAPASTCSSRWWRPAARASPLR